MSDTHPLRQLLDRLEAEVTAAGDQSAAGMSALTDGELQDITIRSWRLLQQLQGTILVPTVAEADQRRLHKTRRYESAGSMRDLIAKWLHCDPPVAGKLLKVAKYCVNGPFPTTAAVLASGEIDLEHATRVVGAVRRLPAFVDRDQRRDAENSMLTVAKTTTPEVTNKAGYRLMELIAPHEAAEHLDHKAERERLRAEEARWFDVTSTPIAGCKELRLRLETSTMNTLSRLVESLTQPAVTDPTGDDPAQDDHPAPTATPQPACHRPITAADSVTGRATATTAHKRTLARSTCPPVGHRARNPRRRFCRSSVAELMQWPNSSTRWPNPTQPTSSTPPNSTTSPTNSKQSPPPART